MLCKCNKEASLNLSHASLCDSCFVEFFERKLYSLFTKKSYNPKNYEIFCNRNRALYNFAISKVISKIPFSKEKDKSIIKSFSLDEFLEAFFNELYFGEKNDRESIFNFFSEYELENYARINSIDYEPFNSTYKKDLDFLDKKYNIKRAVLKSYNFLKEKELL